MNLTEEQWQIIAPLIPPPSPAAGRGRPLINERRVLDGILWKLRSNAPWCEMPASYPSWQTCYRRYRLWQRTGVFSAIERALWSDLRDRGGLDTQKAFFDGTFTLNKLGGRRIFTIAPELKGTWQLATALLYIQKALKKLKGEHAPRIY